MRMNPKAYPSNMARAVTRRRHTGLAKRILSIFPLDNSAH